MKQLHKIVLGRVTNKTSSPCPSSAGQPSEFLLIISRTTLRVPVDHQQHNPQSSCRSSAAQPSELFSIIDDVIKLHHDGISGLKYDSRWNDL